MKVYKDWQCHKLYFSISLHTIPFSALFTYRSSCSLMWSQGHSLTHCGWRSGGSVQVRRWDLTHSAASHGLPRASIYNSIMCQIKQSCSSCQLFLLFVSCRGCEWRRMNGVAHQSSSARTMWKPMCPNADALDGSEHAQWGLGMRQHWLCSDEPASATPKLCNSEMN